MFGFKISVFYSETHYLLLGKCVLKGLTFYSLFYRNFTRPLPEIVAVLANYTK